MTAFQTIFYHKPTGNIIAVESNRYIKSKKEKVKFCGDFDVNECAFFYFPSMWPVIVGKHHINRSDPTCPPILMDGKGVPMIDMEKRYQFVELTGRYKTIIIDLADSMGDQILRASVIAQAEVEYPANEFYCKVEEQYREVMELCPQVKLFTSYDKLGLDKKQCGEVKLNGGRMYDSRGAGFNKACVYGSFLNLAFVPYITTLQVPEDFVSRFMDFDKRIGLRADRRNVVFQLRSKEWDIKCWPVTYIRELASLIKSVYDCNIYYLGLPVDLPEEYPEFVNLAGKTNWIETVRLLTQSSHVFCIDSSIGHLCRALGVPCYRIWGATHPQQIFGEDPTDHDFVDTFKLGPSDILHHTPLRVFNRAFPGDRKTVPVVYDPARNFSQHGDQEIIFEYFSKHPPLYERLVDVGAFGRDMSNSFALLELGWKGLLIEPNPDRVQVIKEEFKGLDVEVLNIGISDDVGELPLHLHSELGHDSFDSDWHLPDKTGKVLTVPVQPLSKVLGEKGLPYNFDLLSIDAEGWDERIIKYLFAKSRFRPTLVVTECTSYADAEGLFGSYGYELIARTGNPDYGNLIFAQGSPAKEKKPKKV